MSAVANEERLMKIILSPHVSEKASQVEENKQYIFWVIADANKVEVKRAVELLFSVKVDKVNIANPHTKVKRTIHGDARRKRVYKKAYVTLLGDGRIDLSAA